MTPTKPNILVVEDDPDHLAIVQYYLGKCGDLIGEVCAVGDLGAAHARLAEGGINLTLLDLTLPASTLAETIEEIASLRAYGVPVVAMSSLDTPDLAERVRFAGGFGFLSKGALNLTSLRALLDGAFRADSPSAQATGQDFPRGEGVRRAESCMERTFDTNHVVERLAHDAGSWLASLSFRLAALAADPAIKASPSAGQHLAPMRSASGAIGHYVKAGRLLIADECAEVELRAVELSTWVGPAYSRWSKLQAGPSAAVEACDLPKVMADEHGLLTVVGILAENAALHRDRAATGEPLLTLRPTTPKGQNHSGAREVSIEAVDNGGSWGDIEAAELGTPAVHGRKDRTRPGLGLYRVASWMRRMGGRAAVLPREDSPGGYAVRLTFPSPPRG